MGPGIEPLPGKEKAVAKQQAGGGMASQFPEFEALAFGGGGPSGGESDGIEPLSEDVVNGHEPKGVFSAGGDFPENPCLLHPVLLLERVLNIVPCLRPW